MNTNRIYLILLIPFLSFKISYAQKRNHQERPNIIFILTDDQRFDALGYAGNAYTNTPQMDALAKAGTYFHDAIATTPICAASRASILTGLYERSHNYNFQTGNIRDEYMENSYPTLLKNNGYYNGFFGKYGVKYDDLDKQFDVYESYDRNNHFTDRRAYFFKKIGNDTVHLTRYTGQKALDFIDKVSNNNDKPFCLSLSFSAPHAHDRAPKQYFWQDTTDPLLQDTIIPDPSLSEDAYFEAQPKIVREGFNRLRWTWRYDTPEKYQHSLKGYYRMISGIDLEIKKIRKKLKEKGLDKNTVIILMGDNGYFLGERQLAGKWLMYDSSIRVPLIVYDPRVNQHHDLYDMALNIDVPSTIADLAGIKAPDSWQGKSLMPLVRDGSRSMNRDTILIEHLWDFKNIPPSEGVRTNEWKYFRYVNDKSIEELYNLKEDSLEIHNLIHDKKYKNLADNLRNKLDELAKKYGDKYRKPPFNLTVELIREPGKGVRILDEIPEFGWEVPEESKFQIAYQILVASSQDILANNNADVWDSGRIRSSLSTNVSYQGDSLEIGKSYYWKVRIWDEQNRLVDYSKPQKFTIGKTASYIQSTQNKFEVDTISPVLFDKRGNSYFMDFGKDAFATLNFTYHTKKPDSLTIRIGEMLDGEKINRKPPKNSNIRYQELKVFVSPDKTMYQIDIKPNERNTLPKAIALPEGFPVLMPFRYAEIEGTEGSVSPDQFNQLAYHTYWKDTSSSFKSNDTILNQVWDICKYSIKATTFSGLYIDGDRERIPYEADAYINQLGHYNTDSEYAMARRTIEYFMKHPTWPTEWQQHVPLLVYEDYMYTGNTELIKRYYEELKHKSLYELSNSEGLISSENVTPEFMYKLGFEEGYKKPLTDIVDWPSAHFGGSKTKGERDGFVFKKYNTVINAFFYQNMKIMTEFATVLGKTEDALDFKFRAARVRKVLNDQLFDKVRGVYVDGIGTDHASIHANMMPLAFGLVPKDRIDSVVNFIKSRGMACSVYGAQFLLDGLYKARAGDYALELLTSTSDRSWYNMIRSGSTMTMEAWDLQYKINLDWNHAWGAAPANIIPRDLWGIKPKTPGFSVATIDPQMGKLKSSSITVPTVRGPIKANYEFVSQRNQTYTIEIPVNMIAEFMIDNISGKEIVHNGKTVPVLSKSITLGPGKHIITFTFNAF